MRPGLLISFYLATGMTKIQFVSAKCSIGSTSRRKSSINSAKPGKAFALKAGIKCNGCWKWSWLGYVWAPICPTRLRSGKNGPGGGCRKKMKCPIVSSASEPRKQENVGDRKTYHGHAKMLAR